MFVVLMLRFLFWNRLFPWVNSEIKWPCHADKVPGFCGSYSACIGAPLTIGYFPRRILVRQPCKKNREFCGYLR
jgi:hypothetical protein